MAEIMVSEEMVLAAPPDVVYECIADYNRHHANFLPPAFSDLKVVSGPGRGAGTVISFKMKLGGVTRMALSDVTEPEPGRALIESDRNSGTVTTFIVEPAEGGSRVRFDTVLKPRGLEGLLTRLLAPRMIKSIYRDELKRLEAYAQKQAAGPAA